MHSAMYPNEHMDSAYDNGIGCLRFTDHGNQNALAEMVLHAKKMQKAGKELKPISALKLTFILVSSSGKQIWKRQSRTRRTLLL